MKRVRLVVELDVANHRGDPVKVASEIVARQGFMVTEATEVPYLPRLALGTPPRRRIVRSQHLTQLQVLRPAVFRGAPTETWVTLMRVRWDFTKEVWNGADFKNYATREEAEAHLLDPVPAAERPLIEQVVEGEDPR